MIKRAIVLSMAVVLAALAATCGGPFLPAPLASVPVLSAPTVTNDATPTWTWTPSTNAAKYRVSLDASDGPWTELGADRLSWTPDVALNDGVHILYAQAANQNGVWSSSSIRSVSVDTVAPDAPTLRSDTPTNDDMPTWSWTVPPGSSGFEYRVDAVDDAEWSSLTLSTTSWTPSTPFPDRTAHTLSVRAMDAAGNRSAAASREVWIDKALLDPPVVSGTSPVYVDAPAWSWAAVPAATGYRYSLDAESGPWTEVDTGVLSFTASAVSSGVHVLYVQARNAAGDWSGSGSRAIQVILEATIRLMAANLTSGTNQDYDGGEGIRIMQGCAPDVVMVQEFAYLSNSTADYQAMANLVVHGTATPTANADWWVEPYQTIPNGVISRYPILEAGEWDDTYLTDRDFAWARIDVPGTVDLWVVSIHIKASSGETDKAKRTNEAILLETYVDLYIPEAAYLATAGDFNTYSNDSATEPCLAEFDDMVIVTGPYPADHAGDIDTNSGRSAPYDRVLVDADLDPFEIPVVLGSSTFPNGAVIDTRVYTPLSDIAPALATDSAALNMQHMGVVRDFRIPLD